MSWPVDSLTEFASVPLWVCWSSPCPRSAKTTQFSRKKTVLQALLATQWLSCQQAPGSAWWPPCLLQPMERKRKCSHMKRLHAPIKTCSALVFGSSAIKHNAFRKSPPPQQAPQARQAPLQSSGQRNQGASMPKDAVVAKRVEAFDVILLLVR